MYKQPKKALNCLIDTYEEIHATNRGITTSKVEGKNMYPLTPRNQPTVLAQAHTVGWNVVLGKKIRPTFFGLNLLYISLL